MKPAPPVTRVRMAASVSLQLYGAGIDAKTAWPPSRARERRDGGGRVGGPAPARAIATVTVCSDFPRIACCWCTARAPR